MNRLKLTLGGVWLIASVSAVVMPIFLPSYSGTPGFAGNAMAVSGLTMFFLSFPSSVVAVPLLFFINVLLGPSTSSITVAYINILIMFVVGAVQWFWIVPRLLERKTYVQELDLSGAAGNTRLFARDAALWVETDGATPLERAIEQDRQAEPSPRADPQ